MSRPRDEWNARYETGDTPWDMAGYSPTLRAALDVGLLRDRERILVPGCGRGHDVLQLAERGHSPVGVDFAPAAIEALRAAADNAGLSVSTHVGDIFELMERPAASFDGVWEYTCFCAIHPSERDRYVALMTHLVRPGGRLVFGVFPLFRDPGKVEGPPWIVTKDDVRNHFGHAWDVVLESHPTVAPDENRAGREALMVLERR